MSAPLQPGDVVVCVDDRGTGHVARDRLYRVRGVRDKFLYLDGVRGTTHDGMWASRFRKIDDEVTESFRSMLRNLPVKQGEDA